jgi:hypothetical protein
MEFSVDYEKRKNNDLFKVMQKKNGLNVSNIQNYNPIYKKFFLLNETNYNSVNFNNNFYIQNMSAKYEEKKNTYLCEIQNLKDTTKKNTKPVFFKLAPLLDPFKYLIGKYNINDKTLFELPNYKSSSSTVNHKILDENNSSYIDGLFVFLSSKLLHAHKFSHGLDYYGAFLATKNNFTLNVIDDIEYLAKSSFFNENKNKLFQIEDYSYLLDSNEDGEKKPLLKIDKNISKHSTLSIESINENIYDNLFLSENENTLQAKVVTLQDMKDLSLEILEINNLLDESSNKITTIRSNSTCSSRTSHTSNGEKMENADDDCRICDSDESTEWEDEEDSDESLVDGDEPEIEVVFPTFPVEIICMEYCENTFDNLIDNNPDLPEEEWFSALMQIIMILLTYQKTFSFTHNDLHTNNVMYNTTKNKFVYYCYKKKYYKVPTFGRIFKIIDFGRSIYKFDGKLFCSDSFQPGADAATQYNTEPYFNNKKARLEPNFSFDLCRLACSMFDYVVDNMDEVSSQNLAKCSSVVKLINEWCLDDNGVNVLYKNNGSERYPDFKLYKMIARLVHNHTPQVQLERKEFSQYEISKNKLDDKVHVINIDEIPCLI